jgi:hypothetical protein
VSSPGGDQRCGQPVQGFGKNDGDAAEGDLDPVSGDGDVVDSQAGDVGDVLRVEDDE